MFPKITEIAARVVDRTMGVHADDGDREDVANMIEDWLQNIGREVEAELQQSDYLMPLQQEPTARSWKRVLAEWAVAPSLMLVTLPVLYYFAPMCMTVAPRSEVAVIATTGYVIGLIESIVRGRREL